MNNITVVNNDPSPTRHYSLQYSLNGGSQLVSSSVPLWGGAGHYSYLYLSCVFLVSTRMPALPTARRGEQRFCRPAGRRVRLLVVVCLCVCLSTRKI